MKIFRKEHITMCQNEGNSTLLILEKSDRLSLTKEQEEETLRKKSLPELLQWMVDNKCNSACFTHYSFHGRVHRPSDESIDRKLGIFLTEHCKGRRMIGENLLIVSYKNANWSIRLYKGFMGRVSVVICKCNFVPI
jgi:hypothetical protein